jgi:glycosyltransferase involved in cell wall biosynthesis
MKNKISIVSPCYNEEEVIEKFYFELVKTLNELTEYEFEILFIDNASTDNTINILRNISKIDNRVKIIVNSRNFGQVRSPYWGLMQTTGQASILIASDLQDPPDTIKLLLCQWNMGWKVVLGQKPLSETNYMLHIIRKIYYKTLSVLSDYDVIQNANGFGLYDKSIIKIIKEFNDPYPYLRGLVCEIGFPIKCIDYVQRKRIKGNSKSNFLHLYDVGILGFINNTILPLRITSLIGFGISLLSFISCIFFVVRKILYWDDYIAGAATIISLIFFMFGLQFCFLGIMGEYIASIFTQLRKRPAVIEKERINF